jgi:PAS domain S-box-containing protein
MLAREAAAGERRGTGPAMIPFVRPCGVPSSMSPIHSLRRLLAAVVSLGVAEAQTSQAARRVRLTNLLALLGFAVAAVSVPFDLVSAPSWVAWTDVGSLAVFAGLPLLNLAGRWLTARVALVVYANVLVVFSAAGLGRAAGLQQQLFAFAAVPFVLFEPLHRGWIALLAGFSIASFFALEAGGFELLARWQTPIESHRYFYFSTTVAFVTLLFVVVHFLRENSRSEDALVESAAHYRMISETARDAIVTLDEGGRVLSASPSAGALFGLPVAQLQGERLARFLEDPLVLERSHGTTTGFQASGKRLPLELTVGASHDTNRRLRTAILRDLSERREAEALLEEVRAKSVVAAKMAALGEMSGSIAHEINNPLTAVSLTAARLRLAAEKGPVESAFVVENAVRVQAIVGRIARIVDGLRSFARDAAGDPFAETPVATVVEETLVFCRERFRQHGIRLEVAPIAAEVTVECRRVQLSQVLLNLLNNAHDAVEPLEEKWVRLTAERRGAEVELAVVDSGAGIPPAVRDRILMPFFTTKPFGRGTGLGLSVSAGIVAAHQGRLFLDTESPNTRFVIRLPLRQAEAGATAGRGEAAAC